MKPKDLKNSEELKSTTPTEPNQPKDADVTKKEATQKEEKVTKESPKTEVVEPVISEVQNKEESKKQPPKEIVEEETKAETEESKVEDKVVEKPPKKEEAEPEAKAETPPKVSDEVTDEKVEKPDAKIEAVEEVPKPKEEVEATEGKPAKEEEVKETSTVAEETTKVAEPEIKEQPEASDVKEEEEATKQEEQPKEENPAKDKTEVAPSNEAKKAQEKKEEVAEKKDKKIDYTTLSQVELVNALRDLLDLETTKDIKYEVELIKSNFYKLFNLKIEEQKSKFIADGGVEEEFVAETDPYEQDIKNLLKRFRIARIEFNKRQEVIKEENLKEKYQVIEDIKNLINNEESINKTFQDFRDLQIKWREIGLVPQSKMKDLWDTYHFHVENFYDYIKINKELRDLDLRKNLEIKIKLCERAEELLVEPSIIKAFNSLQRLHEQWREIGPVPRDNKDDIWERFKAATSKINKKHQEFFETRKGEQKKNLEAKSVLCEKAESIVLSELTNHRDWDEKSKELVELQKVWRTIGFAPKRDNNKIYERFRTACDKFFDGKREFYSKNKELQQNNLQMKIDLCVQAEGLKESTDWRKTTQDFVNIQKKWKEIGPVPRKHSDTVWKRFRAACDFFFEKKSEHFSSVDGEQVENMKLKEELVEEVSKFESSGDTDKDLKLLKDYQRRWTEIGHVPIRQKDEIQNKFREAINKHFDALELDSSKRNILKFRNKVSNFSETSRGQNKMRLERDKYMTKLKQVENDLVLLDNNIGFFAQSKNAESLIADVKLKIEQSKEKIEFLKNKIRIIDEYDKLD